jgi:hypothetical protein
MKTLLAIRWPAANGCLSVLRGLPWFVGLWLGVAGPPPATAAGDWALRFNGATQYVQVPLGESVVLDDRGPQFLALPDTAWLAAFATNAWQGNSLRTTNPAATARWTPRLPRAGTYKVYAWWGGTNVLLDVAAQYVVKSAAGLSTNVVNQNSSAGQWALLGTFDFQADREEFVELRRTSSGDSQTLADAVRFVNDQAFDFRQALTLEAWVKRVGIPTDAWESIITKGDAWGLLCYSNYLCFRTRDAVTLQDYDLFGAQPLGTSVWHHVAATYDGVSKRLYVDGSVAATAAYSASLTTNAYPVWLGGNAEQPGTNYFQGELENVRIWSLARATNDLQSYATNRLRGSEAGLLGDWRFDDDAATNFLTLDSAAGALHGELRESNSPPTQVTGLAFGPPLLGSIALQFNGYDQYVSVAEVTDGRFDFTNAGTVEAWVYFDFAPAATVSLVSKGTNAWDLALNANGKIVFRTDGVTPPELLSKTRLDAGAWYHVAAVWDGSAGRKAIYINGLLDATATSLQGQIAASFNDVQFAARPFLGGRDACFCGILDEVRLWSVARPGTKIAANFERRLNGTEPGLAGAWSFDEGSGLTATDRSPAATPAPGTMAGGMGDLNRVAGRGLGAALLLQYCLDLDGQSESVEIGPADDFNVTNLTIEAWVKPTGTGLRTILRKGDGYGLAVDDAGYLRFCTTNPASQWPRSSRTLEPERDAQGTSLGVMAWNHVGVVVDRSANTTTFYINGQPAGTNASSLICNNTNALVLGRQAGATPANFFRGLLDEVRLWSVPRSSVEMDLFAFTPLLGATPAGLIGYWTFNEGTGTQAADHSGAGHDGSLVNMGLSNWQDGTDWGLPALPGGVGGVSYNTNAAGLWLGQVTLQKVNEVQSAVQGTAEEVTPTADAATIRLLLHVAADGQVRLLKDVIIMQHPTDTNSPPNTTTNPIAPVTLSQPATNLVLITRPELISEFQGVTQRGGKLVGLRYGSVAYDFDGTELSLLGGVGPGNACLGRISLSKNHPTNPYRHKYHPDHRSGFAIVRQITLQFDGAVGDPWQEAPGYGLDRLTGTYRETVVGLHKIPLQVEGTLRLDRINTVNCLNDGR